MNYYGGQISEVIYPFGRGALTSTGIQMSPAVSTTSSASTIETVTVPLPNNAVITELEAGLSMLIYNTVTTANAVFGWQIKDDGQTLYDELVISTAVAACVTTPAVLATPSGNSLAVMTGRPVISTGTYFTGHGTFQITSFCHQDVTPTTNRLVGATRNTSYIAYKYYLMA